MFDHVNITIFKYNVKNTFKHSSQYQFIHAENHLQKVQLDAQ